MSVQEAADIIARLQSTCAELFLEVILIIDASHFLISFPDCHSSPCQGFQGHLYWETTFFNTVFLISLWLLF